MSISLQSANVYADLQGLETLRHTDKSDSPEALRFVAQQFEAFFMQMMLKNSHSESMDDGLFDSEQGDFYQDWYDKQLALHLSSGRGIGIADMLVQQLKQQMSLQDSVEHSGDSQAALPMQSPAPRASLSQPATESVGEVKGNSQPALDSPEAFIRHLLPYAQRAGHSLGISPQVVLAQAALETGWGQRINKNANGESSHNLFNIKADHRWQGDRVNVFTLEYRDGVARREAAQFRAYDSYQASFDDYVDFIRSSERYQGALSVAGNDHAFTQELARAGYATDPEYASKIMGIVDRLEIADGSQSVKL